MKDNEFFKKMYIIYICAILILISVIFNGSYAFFSTRLEIQGDSEIEVKARERKKVILSGTTKIEPKNNMIPGDSIETTFTVTNENSEEAVYNLVWNNVTNTFTNKKDLIVTLTLQGAENNPQVTSTFPAANNTILNNNIKINGSTTQTYTLKITYQNTNANQIDDRGAKFGGTLQLGVPDGYVVGS